MDEKSTQLILDNLEKLAIKMGTAIEYIWPLYVKQVFIEAFTGIAFILIFIIMFIFGFYLTNKYWNPAAGYSILTSGHGAIWVVSLCVIGASLFTAVAASMEDCFSMLNPKYKAFRDIINTIR